MGDGKPGKGCPIRNLSSCESSLKTMQGQTDEWGRVFPPYFSSSTFSSSTYLTLPMGLFEDEYELTFLGMRKVAQECLLT